jgi:hypothetical protein
VQHLRSGGVADNGVARIVADDRKMIIVGGHENIWRSAGKRLLVVVPIHVQRQTELPHAILAICAHRRSLALVRAGSSSAARMAMIAIHYQQFDMKVKARSVQLFLKSIPARFSIAVFLFGSSR